MPRNPWCRALDPERFLACWDQAQDTSNAPAYAPVSPEPLLWWLALVRQAFPHQEEGMSCSMRFLGIATLAERGILGAFHHPERGIWKDAIRTLAVAQCHVVTGFNEADVRRRLAKLPLPPV